MTTLDDGLTKKKAAEQQAAVELVRLAQEQGLSLTVCVMGAQTAHQYGPGDRAERGDDRAQLEYEMHDPAEAGTGNIPYATSTNC